MKIREGVYLKKGQWKFYILNIKKHENILLGKLPPCKKYKDMPYFSDCKTCRALFLETIFIVALHEFIQ